MIIPYSTMACATSTPLETLVLLRYKTLENDSGRLRPSYAYDE